MKIFYTGGNGPFMGSRAAGFSVATLQRDWWFGYTPLANASTATIVTVPVTVGTVRKRSRQKSFLRCYFVLKSECFAKPDSGQTWEKLKKHVSFLQAGTLLVSADARQGGVSVGVVSSPVIKGLSVANCVPLRGNLTEAPVEWKPASTSSSEDDKGSEGDKGSGARRVVHAGAAGTAALSGAAAGAGPLASLVGKNVTLEFRLDRGAVLFAFDLPDL